MHVPPSEAHRMVHQKVRVQVVLDASPHDRHRVAVDRQVDIPPKDEGLQDIDKVPGRAP
jgi:hypothetical protein